MEKPIFKKKSKANLIITISLALLALAILAFSLLKAANAVNNFFEVNTLRFHKLVDIKINNPIEVVSRQELQKQQEIEEKAEVITNECIELLLTPTNTPKVKSGIVKQVEATGIYTYPKYSSRPFYGVIIEKLKEMYTSWEDAAELIARESSFDPGAINPSSGSCGLTQALPCKKMACSLTDIDCQLNWQKDYIANRYGTVTEALKHQILKSWY